MYVCLYNYYAYIYFFYILWIQLPTVACNLFDALWFQHEIVPAELIDRIASLKYGFLFVFLLFLIRY